MLEADYVIVGAGSAGCALACRLSEDGRHSVLVLEYGGTDYGPLIQMPAAFSIPMNMRAYDWGYRTEPEPHLGGRRLATPRGKVIGGSSSINGMVFVRGHPADFDRRTFPKPGGLETTASFPPSLQRSAVRARDPRSFEGFADPAWFSCLAPVSSYFGPERAGGSGNHRS